VEFRILGPVEVVGDDGAPVALPAAKVRALLALLVVHRNTRAGVDALVDELWDDDPPATATKTLQVYVSQLRKALGRDRLETVGGGYLLRVDDEELDASRFELLAAQREWTRALALWRGPALADVRAESRACAAAADRLDEARLAAVEERVEADLVRGEHAGLVGELEQLAVQHPWRERLHALLMLALYRSGRQAEALEAYRRLREHLADELGLEPGRDLRELEQAILRQDASLHHAVPAAARTTERRRGRRPLLLVAAALAALAGAVAIAVARNGSNGGSDAELRTFVGKVENVLAQAHEGRAAVVKAVSAGQRCKIPLREAAADIEDARANRQSLLQQLAALAVPDDERARRVATLLQRATAASFAADLRYRRDFLRAHTCPPPLDAAAGRRADRLKRQFTTTFNPLARRFHAREWRPAEL
jgi:DNA-binding SARP family transcriptional activator